MWYYVIGYGVDYFINSIEPKVTKKIDSIFAANRVISVIIRSRAKIMVYLDSVSREVYDNAYFRI